MRVKALPQTDDVRSLSGAYFLFRGMYVQRNILSEEGVIYAANKKNAATGVSKGAEPPLGKNKNKQTFSYILSQSYVNQFKTYPRHHFSLIHQKYLINVEFHACLSTVSTHLSTFHDKTAITKKARICAVF